MCNIVYVQGNGAGNCSGSVSADAAAAEDEALIRTGVDGEGDISVHIASGD